MNPTQQSIDNPITEDDIANFLANTPDFFERHADLLAAVQLSSGHGARAVSLQERQAQMLREKIKGLELRIVEMLRNGQDNVAIAAKIQNWTRSLLLAARPAELPAVITRELQTQFLVPQTAIKVWGVDAAFAGQGFATGVSDDAKAFASSLAAPYCGLNSGFEVVNWLPDPSSAKSVALIPLRPGAAPQAFGLLVLASADPERFQNTMATDFLSQISELASASLSRLRPQTGG